MDPERVKTNALKLSLTDRLELAQALLQSFYPPTDPSVIDKDDSLAKGPDFHIEQDPIVIVESVSESPRRIVIESTELPPESDVQSKASNSIGEAFQKLRGALEAETSK